MPPPLATASSVPDPLSAAPPVVTLKTAVKDLVETAENIFSCFSKDSQGQRTSKAASTALFKAVRELETFCNEHHDLLESSTAMRKLLGQVVQEMEELYRKCCEVSSPRPSSGVLKKLVNGLQSWRHQPPSVEEDIFKLVNHVNQCHIKFTSFTVKRVEKFLLAIAHSSTGQIIRTMGLIRPREDEDEEELRAEVSEGQLVQFMGPTSTSLSMASSRITADLIADMYIRLQVKVINESLMDLSAIKFSKVEEHMEEYTRPFQPLMARTFDSISPSALHDSVVTQTLELQRILREGSTTMSMQEGAWEMVNLSIGLFNLNMYEEASNMGTWTVNLFRKLVEMDEKIYMPYLVHTLRHVTKYYQATDNLDGAIAAIEESLELSRKLVEKQPDAEELTVQLGGVLTTYAMMVGLKDQNEKGLEAINEATALFERMSYRQRGIVDETDVSPITTLSDKALCDYARALHQKSYTLESLGRPEDAIDAEKKATQIMQSLCPLYPDSILETELAEMLYRLCHRDFRNIIPALQALFYAEECVMIYEMFTEHDSQKYGQYLYSAYWEKATIHGLLDQTDEALKTWKKAADLAKRIIADQTFLADALYQACWSLRKLQRHDEAVTIRLESVKTYHEIHKTASVVEANGHYDLAVDLQLGQRYAEALKSAEEALAQYKILAANNPEETKRVAQGQTLVSHIHCDASDLELAYEASREAVRMYQSQTLADTRADHIASYVRCLRIAISIIYRLSHPEKSVGFGEEIVQEFKVLNKDFTKDVGFALAEAMSTLSCILTDLKRPPEATAWILQLIEWFENYEDRSAETTGRHINALIDYASIVDCQGHSERALVPIEKAIKLGLDFGVEDATLVSRTAGAMFRRAHLCCEVGRYADALEISNETLEFVRKNNPSIISDLVGTLQVCVMANHYNHNEEQAMEYAKEAVEICRGEAMTKLVKDQIDDLCFLPNTLIDLSTCSWYVGDHAEAVKVAQEAVDEVMKSEPPKSALNPARWENTYFYALKQLCVTHFANGSLVDDKEILRVKEFSDERMKTHNGYTTQMVELLDTLQLYYCMNGRHEEGAKYGKELEDLRARLHASFPELARQVERELDWRRGTSSWVGIMAKLDLKCGHYHGSLIEL